MGFEEELRRRLIERLLNTHGLDPERIRAAWATWSRQQPRRPPPSPTPPPWEDREFFRYPTMLGRERALARAHEKPLLFASAGARLEEERREMPRAAMWQKAAAKLAALRPPIIMGWDFGTGRDWTAWVSGIGDAARPQPWGHR